jgi:hypothetical protein
MSTKLDDHWRPEPLPPRPAPELPPPITGAAEVAAAFAAAVEALRALATAREAAEEEGLAPSEAERLRLYRGLFRALDEVARTPLLPEERDAWSTLQDTINATGSGARVRQAARTWTEIGRAVADRMTGTTSATDRNTI